MFELSRQHCRFVYTMYNVHGMKCTCIIIVCIKCHCTSGADMPQSNMKIVTVRPCTPVHIYMYTEVIIICT